MRSCHSIPECCVMFSGVKLSMESFVLFIIIICSWLTKFSSTTSVQTRFVAPQKQSIDTFLVIKVIIS